MMQHKVGHETTPATSLVQNLKLLLGNVGIDFSGYRESNSEVSVKEIRDYVWHEHARVIDISTMHKWKFVRYIYFHAFHEKKKRKDRNKQNPAKNNN